MKSIQRRGLKAKVVKNKLQVIELINGSLPLDKLFVLNTLKFGSWIEDMESMKEIISIRKRSE